MARILAFHPGYLGSIPGQGIRSRFMPPLTAASPRGIAEDSRIFTEDSRTLLQNPKDLCCDSSIGACQSSKQHPSPTLALQAPLAQVAEQLSWQVQSPFKISSFLGHSANRPE